MPANYRTKRQNQTFPTARMHFCADHATTKNAIKFFKYWSDLSPEHAELASVKIYRTWPQVDLRLSEPGRTRLDWDTIQGPIPFPPDTYIEWFIEKYGSGEWKCMMNEAQVHDSIIECAFSALDPTGKLPQVDLKTVVWGNFKNENFRTMLKNQGIKIPGENPEQEQAEQEAQEEEEVQTTAVEALVDTMKETQQQNRELLKQVVDKPAPAASPSVSDHAESKIVDMVAGAATKTIDMVMQHAGKPYDPLDMWKSIMESIPKPDTAGNTELFKLMLASQAASAAKTDAFMLKFMEVRIEEIKAAAQVKTAETTAVVKAEKSLIEQLKEAKEVVDLFSGGRRRRNDDDEDEPKKPNWFELLLQNGPQIATALAPVLTGIGARFGLIQPQPIPVQQTAVQQNGTPRPQVHPVVAEMQSKLPPELHKWIPVMLHLERPFLANFTADEKNGYDLAEHIIGEALGTGPTTQGRLDYMAIRETLGPKVEDGKVIAFPFYQLLQAHPTIWPSVFNLQPQLEQYLREFFSYDEMMAKEQEEAPSSSAKPS